MGTGRNNNTGTRSGALFSGGESALPSRRSRVLAQQEGGEQRGWGPGAAQGRQQDGVACGPSEGWAKSLTTGSRRQQNNNTRSSAIVCGFRSKRAHVLQWTTVRRRVAPRATRGLPCLCPTRAECGFRTRAAERSWITSTRRGLPVLPVIGMPRRWVTSSSRLRTSSSGYAG